MAKTSNKPAAMRVVYYSALNLSELARKVSAALNHGGELEGGIDAYIPPPRHKFGRSERHVVQAVVFGRAEQKLSEMRRWVDWVRGEFPNLFPRSTPALIPTGRSWRRAGQRLRVNKPAFLRP